MMRVVMTTLGLLALVIALASKSYSSDDYQYFFKSQASKLSLEDQKRIYELMDLRHDPATQRFIQSECPPAEFDTEFKDLNHDGVMEVFVHGGNTCTSGNAARRLWVFVKSAQSLRHYQLNFGVPVGEYEILTTYNRGYPDIQVGGPGFCLGIWRWNGARYDHFKNVPITKNGCTSR